MARNPSRFFGFSVGWGGDFCCNHHVLMKNKKLKEKWCVLLYEYFSRGLIGSNVFERGSWSFIEYALEEARKEERERIIKTIKGKEMLGKFPVRGWNECVYYLSELLDKKK